MSEKNAHAQEAKDIIDNNSYMVICTATADGKPWGVPVFFAFSPNYKSFYFISAIDSRHAENMDANPMVSMVIFDSSSPIGSSEGVEIEGSVYVVGSAGIKDAINIYSERLSRISKSDSVKYDPDQYLSPAEFRFFEVKVQKIYVSGEERRVEVDLS